MNNSICAHLVSAMIGLLMALGAMAPSAAWAISLDQQATFDIAAQPLPAALVAFSRQAEVQVVTATKDLEGYQSGEVKGRFTLRDAITRLLGSTGLAYKVAGGSTLVVGRAASLSAVNSGLLFAQASGGNSADKAPGEAVPLEGIVVTAQKRSELQQDVPVPVTVLDAKKLVDTNQLRLQDYYASIPGLSVTPNDNGTAHIAIRGLTTGGYTNATVGIVVDDVPFGPSSALVTGAAVPDIDPSDLARVEVLRGPQGTLYGASSIGGLLKFVTVDPSTEGVFGSAQAGLSSVHNGAELGYNLRGSVNVPLSDTLAVLASGFTRQDPGYIDNPVLGIRGINEQRVGGGRLSALWRPSEEFSLKLGALYQKAKRYGSNDVDRQSGLGDLQQNYIRGIGYFDKTIQVYSANLTAKLGSIDLTAVTGYNVYKDSSSFDYTNALAGLTQSVFGVAGTPVYDNHHSKKLTQEIRLSGSMGRSAEDSPTLAH
jgi:outer membrane receptor protein involved in Fe transport